MKNIRFEIMKNYFDWIKIDFYLSIFFIFVVFIAGNFFNVHPLLFSISVVIVFFYCLMISFTAVVGNSSYPGSGFSWKFFVSLPITRKELIYSLIINRLMTIVPIIVLLFVFRGVAYELLKHVFSIEDFNYLKFVTNFILFMIFGELWTIYSAANGPRIAFQKMDASKKMIRYFRKYLCWLTGIIFVFFGTIWLDFNYPQLKIIETARVSIKLILQFVFTWSPFFFLGACGYFYNKILKAWINEKAIYKKPVSWNPFKEWSIIATCSVAMTVFYIQMDAEKPSFYNGNEFGELIQKKNYKQVSLLAKKSSSIMKANEYGFTPMLMAIHSGDLKMVKLLESLGANFDGHLQSWVKNHENYDSLMLAVDSDDMDTIDYILKKKFDLNKMNLEIGYLPIHYAVARCKPKLVDHLISLGADVNVLNANGETPALVAARSKCLGAIVTLHENGANLMIADNKGQRVNDYLEKDKSNSYFNHFIEKYTRAPASK